MYNCSEVNCEKKPCGLQDQRMCPILRQMDKEEMEANKALLVKEAELIASGVDICPVCGANLTLWRQMGLGDHYHYISLV